MRKIKILKNDRELCNFSIEGQKIDIIVESEIEDEIAQIYKLVGINLFDDKLKLASDCWNIKYKNLRKK